MPVIMDNEMTAHKASVSVFVLAFVIVTAGCTSDAATARQGHDIPDDSLTQTDVFVSGTEGYSIYRIPAIAVTNKGTSLAFAEGRASIHDTAKNDIVLK